MDRSLHTTSPIRPAARAGGARPAGPAVARLESAGGTLRKLTCVSVALAVLWCGALRATANGHQAAVAGADTALTADTYAGHTLASVDGPLLLRATPETAAVARSLSEEFCAQSPGVRPYFSVCPTAEALEELRRRRVHAVIVPRVLNPDEARRFVAKGEALTVYPLRLAPFVGPGKPRPGELPRTAYLYAFDQTVRGRAVVDAFSTYARVHSVSFASKPFVGAQHSRRGRLVPAGEADGGHRRHVRVAD